MAMVAGHVKLFLITIKTVKKYEHEREHTILEYINVCSNENIIHQPHIFSYQHFIRCVIFSCYLSGY